MAKSISFERFDFGLDLRKGPSTSDANRLRVLKNGYTSEGGMLRRDGAIVPVREECELFELARVPWREPQERNT